MKGNGVLTINKYYRTPRLEMQYAMLCRAFASRGIRLDVRANDGFAELPCQMPDFVLSWDKDYLLARRWECAGVRVFDSAAATRICDDKGETHVALAQAGVPTPKTLWLPFTYENVGFSDRDFIGKAAELLNFPMIVKQARSSYGMDVYLCRNAREAASATERVRGGGIVQQFIAESAGRDLRVNVVGGIARVAVLRENKEDFRSNVLRGGTMRACPLTAEAAALAERAAAAVGADFAGVDLLESADGLLVCEVNSCAHFGGVYRATGVDLAQDMAAFVDGAIYGA